MAKQSSRLHSPADFGLAVQQSRLERGLSQQQVAEEAGLRQSTVSEIENGKATVYIRQLLEISRATGLEFSATWGEDDETRR